VIATTRDVRSQRRSVGIAALATVLFLSAAFGGTVWRYDVAQAQAEVALQDRADRMRDQEAALVFWREREAINEYLITGAPQVLTEVGVLHVEFSRITEILIRNGNPPRLAQSRRANDRLSQEFGLRARADPQHGSAARAIKALHSYEEAVLAPLRQMNIVESAHERAASKAAAGAARQAQLVAILGAIVALITGLGFAVYVSRLLRRVTGQARVLERTLAEREHAHVMLQDRDQQLRQAQKMEAIGRLAGGVAHDFNNMLLAITGYGALALADVEPGPGRVRHALEQIELAAGRAAALTSQLLAFSRQQVRQPQVVDVNRLVGGLTGMLKPLLGGTVQLHLDLDPRAGAVEADPGQLEQAITNVVLNSRDAMPAGGRIAISTSTADASDISTAEPHIDYMSITVTDTGEGMDEETKSRALDPFFTTKEQGKGTGLGLATVHGIVTQSGGELRIDSAPGQGTAIAIYLPRTTKSPDAPEIESASAASAATRGSETVLLVEDDRVARALLFDVLTQHGYDVLVASDGEEALAVAAEADVPPDLLITDVVMPVIGGRVLAERMQSVHPEMRVIYISGYTQDSALYEAAEAGLITFLQKPFKPDDILRTIRAVLPPPAEPSAAREVVHGPR
jgi:two-component system cell cycle sensor histidine kinase/response regulator CckA